ncbi:histidine kinase [Paraflavitalea speifideaquila]|uniref:histidine kinase n=1 Tax=Paraflavitalea speifideaquila TaxID=3076558 RepID=UPI0028E86863|nr:histidine kinase [Paraflavitalea speifideiaquila]
MQSRLLGLKSQLNPHFLFNCFNTLSSLIAEDPRQAESFLDELSKVYHYLLPSLSLQLLVENAVRHNVVSRQQPLVIDLFTMAGNQLAVNNNLQSKTIKYPSNKIGLANIRLKYELLEQPGFQVFSDTRNFTVILPLIWHSGYEKKLSVVQKYIH